MKQLKFFATLLVAALSFASCIDDETSRLTPSPATALGEGVFILNQGNQYAKIDGSYSFFDWETNVLSNSVFSTVNGRLLGAGPQDGVLMVRSNLLVFASITCTALEPCNVT